MTCAATTRAEARPARMSLAAGVRLIAIGLSTLLGLALARWLGDVEYGRFEAAMAQAALLAVPAAMGVEKLVVRETASRKDVRELLRWAKRRVFVASALVALSGLAWSLLFPTRGPDLFVVAVAVVPLTAVLRLQQGEIQGRDCVVAGQFVELVLMPMAVLGTLVVVRASGAFVVDARSALACQVFGLCAAIAAGVAVQQRARQTSAVAAGLASEADPARWRSASAALLLLAALQVAHTRADVAVFAAFAPFGEVGRFAVATRIANLIGITLLVANAVIAPRLARAHRVGDGALLQSIAVRAARQATVISLAIAVPVLIAPRTVLALFGPDYAGAADALVVLVAAQVFNVAMGSVGLVLLMSGHERAALPGLALGAVVDILLLVVLAPELGATGAAWARAAGLLSWNIALACAVRRRLGTGVHAWAVLR